MLDIKLIKENPEEIKARLRAKEVNMDAEIDRILELDLLRRENIKKTEALKAEQNKVTKSIPAMKKAGQDTTEIFAQMKALSEEIKVNDAKLKEIEENPDIMAFSATIED